METLKLEFKIDREKRSILVEKEFSAPLDVVWSAWTRAETLDKWWAPKPWKAKTKRMNFRENGSWLYAMQSPEGEEHYALAQYKEIVQEQRFVGLDSFCDENGVINEDLPKSTWKVEFEPEGSHTLVIIETEYETEEALDAILKMGFQEGFTAGLLQLDEHLEKI
ncbi:SRPBCC family protein [Christiangramia sediminis]|uniref:SRPBCC domain-containing protein n=1 Tax=Christiangramia sediminis TaxID=2881336 RepID=A0A9X1RZS4_9FLAO|nr:SRPBCC domain-containing protein [Christiangramia sediminis]MCB7482540.1 SRPBCC domain-containing protein [Christiangramia sediminis]